uniref:Uncharacterized protein n=1 Tax=Hyaloperonospora arabidopsidis (strain Emoy2) TaxID=559515 RepID=M4BT84_HYAAE
MRTISYHETTGCMSEMTTSDKVMKKWKFNYIRHTAALAQSSPTQSPLLEDTNGSVSPVHTANSSRSCYMALRVLVKVIALVPLLVMLSVSGRIL